MRIISNSNGFTLYQCVVIYYLRVSHISMLIAVILRIYVSYTVQPIDSLLSLLALPNFTSLLTKREFALEAQHPTQTSSALLQNTLETALASLLRTFSMMQF